MSQEEMLILDIYRVSQEEMLILDIYSVPGGKVNILGGHSIGQSKQDIVYMYMCPIPNRFRDKSISKYSTLYTALMSNTPYHHTSCKVH
jgi:hypothetical protein